MERKILNYENVIDSCVLEEIKRVAQPLEGLSLLHINSTLAGGGVAEMLHSLVPLFNDVGIKTRWEVIEGTPLFFDTTKQIHNALQGGRVKLDEEMQNEYERINRLNANQLDFKADVVVSHDPQPLPLIDYNTKKSPWIWRCHIDFSTPDKGVWEMLKPFIARYDAMVISSESFAKPELSVPTHIIPPAIDPFSEINRDLPQEEIAAKLAEYDIPQGVPLIVQVSRFDKWKDPLGVLKAFRRVQKEACCHLVMLGNMASDDPEGPKIYADVAAQAEKLDGVQLITKSDPLLVNALQRTAAVVVQLSRKEGFGLTVSEALWKGTPVVATRVGGIPLQIEDGRTGFLVDYADYDTIAERVLQILDDPDLGAELGREGREHVRKNFLMPRLLLDWLQVIAKVG